ncbi:hypothetical protein D3C80_2222960 [compost metagenome]
MIQALEVKSLVSFDDPIRAVSAKCENRKIGLYGAGATKVIRRASSAVGRWARSAVDRY